MSERLFFALWPDERLRASLEQRLPSLARDVPGKPQRADQWHVTLEFMGEVTDERRAALDAAATVVRGEAVRLHFDAIEHWLKPQVLCLAAHHVPAELERLVTRLRAALADHGFMPDKRAFRPHVTLARKVRVAEPRTLDPPVEWPADRFALVRSVTDPAGSRYEPLRWWNLGTEGG